jgi:hypothetical protein
VVHSHGPANLKGNPERPRWELADVIRLHGRDFFSSHPLPVLHLKILRAIERCRTISLGGHLERCDLCGFERPAYNSCRNRHCPKCQSLNKARWLQAHLSEVLPVDYFHVVFTLPHELNLLILSNKWALLNDLFSACSQTLLTFGQNNLGGKAGFIAILHTWDQNLNAHFHLHCLIPAGVLSDDARRWNHAQKGFLFPVRALAKVFRAKYLDLLRHRFDEGGLIFPGQAATFQSPASFSTLFVGLAQKRWVVYAKRPFGGPQKTLDYLGRYTHRVAISNNRILNVDKDGVTFAFRDRKDRNRVKKTALSGDEFLRRFLLHALPSGFVRIRHFGFLANRAKKNDLPTCRQVLGLPQPRQAPKASNAQLLRDLTGIDISRCPICRRGKMLAVADLPSLTQTIHREVPICDSS